MNEPIDIVYLWCDGSEPAVRAKRERRAAELGIACGGKDNGACRYRDNGELRFSLRSVCRFAPWIRNVFVVLDDDQTPPAWLDLGNPRLRIVRHSEILPPESLPCFASRTIEFGIPRIPDLSERFLYANDDMYIARPVKPSLFFASDGSPVCRYLRTRIELSKISEPSAYMISICNNARFIRERVVPETAGAKVPPSQELPPHHNIDSYRKSTLLDFAARFPEDLGRTLRYAFRDGRQLQREVWSSYALALGKGRFRFAKRPWYEQLFTGCRHESLIIQVGQGFRRRFERARPYLFCFNDNPEATQEDIDDVRRFLLELFPEACEFENPKGA